MAHSTYTTVMVRFEKGGKQYTYKTHITDFKVGDEAVVEVKGVTKIVVVTQTHKAPRLDANASYQYKWIICKVDRSVYNQLKAWDAPEPKPKLKSIQECEDEEAGREYDAHYGLDGCGLPEYD